MYQGDKVKKKQPTLYMLCGIPGSGKSTFIANHLTGIPYISSDYYLEKWAKEEGKTYEEIFGERVNQAIVEMGKDLQLMCAMGSDFVWDQTNINKNTRMGKLTRVPSQYKKVAIAFDVGLDVALERNSKRIRSIPEHIIRNMHEQFEWPRFEEGFDSILDAATFTKKDKS